MMVMAMDKPPVQSMDVFSPVPWFATLPEAQGAIRSGAIPNPTEVVIGDGLRLYLADLTGLPLEQRGPYREPVTEPYKIPEPHGSTRALLRRFAIGAVAVVVLCLLIRAVVS